jgi:hypothetical protein
MLASCGDEQAAEASTFPRCEDLAAARLPDPEGPVSGDPAIAEAQRWRAEHGMRSDRAWVEQIAAAASEATRANPETELGRLDLSFRYPLTEKEADEYSHRSNEDVSIALGEYADSFEDSYAGSWFDYSPGGVRVVAFTAGVEDRQRELDDQFGPGVVEVVEAEHTEADLEALQDAISQRWDGDRFVLGLSVSAADNVVAVGLASLDEDSIATLAGAFAGEPICIEQGHEAENASG